MKAFILTTYVSSGEIQFNEDEWQDFDCDETIFKTVEAIDEKHAIQQGISYFVLLGFNPLDEEYFPAVTVHEIKQDSKNPILKAIEEHKKDLETYSYPENKYDKTQSNYDFITSVDWDTEDINIGYEQGYMRALEDCYKLTK